MIAVIFVILIKIYLSYLLAQNFTERKYKGWYLQIKLGPTFYSAQMTNKYQRIYDSSLKRIN